MPRLAFRAGELHKFITRARAATKLSRDDLAHKIGVSSHTLTYWQREKYLPDQIKLTQLSVLSNTPLPTPIEIREDWWSGRVNGSTASKARFAKHGCSYSLEQRRKGGRNSQAARKANPQYYSQLGCPIPRDFIFPKHLSNSLAEFIGILLGDGCIQPSQVSITLNSQVDKNYSAYVVALINKLFSYRPTLHDRFPTKALTILISGINFTKNLVGLGMYIGDKVRQQVGVPSWISTNHAYSRWCLRGLMDTDGGIFTHSYTVNGKTYSYLKTNFTNASQPLLNFVYQALCDNGFHPNNKVPRKVWLYSHTESKRYLEVIGSSNDRLLKKIQMI